MTNQEIKREALNRMERALQDVQGAFTLLSTADDMPGDGTYDLHDQLLTMMKHIDGLRAVHKRAHSVNGTSPGDE